MPRLHSGVATDRPDTTKLPPIPEVNRQKPQQIHLIGMYKNSTAEIKRKNDRKIQTSPIRETSPQVFGCATESLVGNQTRSRPVQCPNISQKQQHEIKRKETDMTTYATGDDNIFFPKKTTSQIVERLLRDDINNEHYMPLSSTIVLKRNKEMLYVPLDFKNGLTIDALADLGAYVSAID